MGQQDGCPNQCDFESKLMLYPFFSKSGSHPHKLFYVHEIVLGNISYISLEPYRVLSNWLSHMDHGPQKRWLLRSPLDLTVYLVFILRIFYQFLYRSYIYFVVEAKAGCVHKVHLFFETWLYKQSKDKVVDSKGKIVRMV